MVRTCQQTSLISVPGILRGGMQVRSAMCIDDGQPDASAAVCALYDLPAIQHGATLLLLDPAVCSLMPATAALLLHMAA